MSLTTRDTIIRQQRELLTGLALCKVSDSAWRKKYFATVCEGLLSNRIYDGNVKQINRVLEEFFPTYISLASLHKKQIAHLLLGLKTTGLPAERIQYYYHKLVQFAADQNQDPQLRNILDLDTGFAIAEVSPAIEPATMLKNLLNYQLIETEQRSLDIQSQFVVVKQRFNLFDTWSNPPQVLSLEPIYHKSHTYFSIIIKNHKACAVFPSAIKGLRFFIIDEQLEINKISFPLQLAAEVKETFNGLMPTPHSY